MSRRSRIRRIAKWSGLVVCVVTVVAWVMRGKWQTTPLPILAIAFGVPAVHLTLVALRRYRWRHEGRCRKCSYDLQGNVSGVCPECGKATLPAT